LTDSPDLPADASGDYRRPSASVAKPLIAKLERSGALTLAEKSALADLVAHTRDLRPFTDIIHAGERPVECRLLLDGWACRYKLLPDGKRQITGFAIAGDLCDLSGLLAGAMDHSVCTLTRASVAVIPCGPLLDLMDEHSGIARALWCETLVEGAIAREWVVNVGRRPAYQRIAHLLCEMALRLGAVVQAHGSSFVFPIRQEELADATGLSKVHVNRTLQEMRRDGLIGWTGPEVTIPDWERLQSAGMFRPGYLLPNGAHMSSATQLAD
jgi:CRP-like cAMP-binding protein